MYSLHFCAATNKGDLRDKALYVGKGIPLFVSEFGTCLASGNGFFFDTAETKVWFSSMDEHNLSWCNWSIADKNETASALVPGARYYGQWKQNELTLSGQVIMHRLWLAAGIVDIEVPPKVKKTHWYCDFVCYKKMKSSPINGVAHFHKAPEYLLK